MTRVTRLDAAFLPTTDMQASIDWFGKTFGFVKGFDSGDGRYVTLHLPDGDKNAMHGFTLYKTDKVDREAHIRFNLHTSDPEAVHAWLAEQGVELTPIQAAGTLRYFDFRDNCGSWVGIVHCT